MNYRDSNSPIGEEPYAQAVENIRKVIENDPTLVVCFYRIDHCNYEPSEHVILVWYKEHPFNEQLIDFLSEYMINCLNVVETVTEEQYELVFIPWLEDPDFVD